MAASVPLSTLSAYQGLFVHGALKPPKEGKNTGKRVLITAASGGVGLWGFSLRARQAQKFVYELERFEEAFKKLEDGHAKGKIILRVGK
ncbi:hypothetical protein PMIN07_012453 [Paraphaeosphaeria minitans]